MPDTTVYVDIDQVNTVLTFLKGAQETFDTTNTQIASVSNFDTFITGTGSAAAAVASLDSSYQALVTGINNATTALDSMISTLNTIYTNAQALASSL